MSNYQTIHIDTSKRTQMLDITNIVSQKLHEMNAENGICMVYCPHTTGGITINENADPDVVRDVLKTMEKLIPHKGDYRHSEGNSDSHVKSSLFTPSQMVIVDNSNLVLGTWQSIFFCEFDGPRRRKVHIKFIKG